MDNNLNNHICNNSHKRMERNFGTRVQNEAMPRREENNACQGKDFYEPIQHYENNDKSYCHKCDNKCKNEHGGDVYSFNVGKAAYRNQNFRESVWTGKYLQMTLMSIHTGQDIGIEIHKDTDQYIRVEYGYALAVTGSNPECLDNKIKIHAGEAIFIPAGTYHNIINIGRCALKLSSVYAPPHHPKCTVQKNKSDNH